MKTSLFVVSTLALFFFGAFFIEQNHVLEPLLVVQADTTRSFTVAPGDTHTVVVRVTNSSHQEVRIADKIGSCRIAGIDIPDRLMKKRVYYLKATLIAPTEPGTYTETVVLRSNSKRPFTGFLVRYTVDPSAGPSPDSLWLGPSTTLPPWEIPTNPAG